MLESLLGSPNVSAPKSKSNGKLAKGTLVKPNGKPKKQKSKGKPRVNIADFINGLDREDVNYHTIKELSKEYKISCPNFVALSVYNDPYFAEMPFKVEHARWFAELWKEHGGPGTHLRRLHYRLSVQHKGQIKLPNGQNYENEFEHWEIFGKTSVYARHLGLVDPEDFIDRRNPDPYLFAQYEALNEPSWNIDDHYWKLPAITTDLSFDCDMPDVDISGYKYNLSAQPYHLEIWIEKSTQNDILIPLCRRHGVNFVTSVGFQSITSIINLINRLKQIAATLPEGKPARIGWISDHDPGGFFMPAAVARELEFYIQKLYPNADIKLTVLALTPEQVIEYDLPRKPIKKTDKRREKFESIHGKGAVELDALEALHPGVFGEIVEDWILSYRDSDLEDNFDSAESEARDIADSAWENATEEHREQLERLKASVDEITAKYAKPLKKMAKDMEKELAPFKADLENISRQIDLAANHLMPEIPAVPEADIDEPDEDDYLFDSSRDYLEQLEYYKAREKTLGASEDA
jgi:hypothetical protein